MNNAPLTQSPLLFADIAPPEPMIPDVLPEVLHLGTTGGIIASVVWVVALLALFRLLTKSRNWTFRSSALVTVFLLLIGLFCIWVLSVSPN